MTSLGSGESKLEIIISYLLIIGVVLSLTLETAGMLIFYRSHGHLGILLEDKALFLQGRNFFVFLGELLKGGRTSNSSILLMSLGIVTLVLTPYIRVTASALYFAWRKDVKYVVITAFVLIVLTVSLILH